jgi:hypothetical protein
MDMRANGNLRTASPAANCRVAILWLVGIGSIHAMPSSAIVVPGSICARDTTTLSAAFSRMVSDLGAVIVVSTRGDRGDTIC